MPLAVVDSPALMRLTLANHPVAQMAFVGASRLDGTTLLINRAELRQHLLEDARLASVDLHLVRPHESCRAGVVFDILEPRAKAPGSGTDFPGILGPMAVAGRGTTDVLRGGAVTVIDEGASLGSAGAKILEMSGEAGERSPYSRLHHLIVVPHAIPGLARHDGQNALRLASVKAATYLARAAVDHAPASTEVFEIAGPLEATPKGLPRIAYIGQIHSRQRPAEVDEQIFYGCNTAGMLPLTLHPNEWLDGAIVTAYMNLNVETYFYQNHPIILQLYRWHQQGKLAFAGTIATIAALHDGDRARNCMLAVRLAKWDLAADGVILTKYGGGAPHADLALTARLCEEMEMRTAVMVSDLSRDRRAESALLFNYPEVDAIVYPGGIGIRWDAPPVERAIGPHPGAAEALAALQELAAGDVCGVVSQQGASRIRSFVY